jgi:alkylated DNA repair dioxygenase AlkB
VIVSASYRTDIPALDVRRLLAADSGWKRIAMPDAEALYLDRLALGQPDAGILQRLIAEVDWRSEAVVMWGRTVPQPRLTAWYGDAGRIYAYSGIELQPLPWTPLLRDIKTRVETVAASSFNSVLLNYYRDNRDSIGFHSDDEPELGRQPVIASLSLGDERTLVFKHKTLKRAEPVRLRLLSGSVLLMGGETQHYWRHGIPKESRPCGPRINLTFRTVMR